MKDIPAFATENGVASLVLRQIPTRNEAYIEVQSSLAPEALLRECVGFCRACGAERVLAAECSGLPEGLTPAYVLWQLRGRVMEASDAALTTVGEDEWARFASLVNARLRAVDHAALLPIKWDGENGAYFVTDGGEVLGAGIVRDSCLRLLVSLRRGMGERTLRALLAPCRGREVSLTVASTNRRAIALYEKCGFTQTAELSRWYDVTGI